MFDSNDIIAKEIFPALKPTLIQRSARRFSVGYKKQIQQWVEMEIRPELHWFSLENSGLLNH